ncbi:hypothetical protein [Oceanobacillus kapialis]|uniref:Sporulation histidine kinase inhibitor Sda n=1 Tax=Oceanobacillus kapialis TaxID=481353 RepID=A0ABW5Q1N6_9BACI
MEFTKEELFYFQRDREFLAELLHKYDDDKIKIKIEEEIRFLESILTH